MPYQPVRDLTSAEQLQKFYEQKVAAIKALICIVIFSIITVISYHTGFAHEKDGRLAISMVIGLLVLAGIGISIGITWISLVSFGPLFGIYNEQPYPQSSNVIFRNMKTGQELNEKSLFHRWYTIVGSLCNIGIIILFIKFVVLRG
jgi:hypothetical protein